MIPTSGQMEQTQNAEKMEPSYLRLEDHRPGTILDFLWSMKMD